MSVSAGVAYSSGCYALIRVRYLRFVGAMLGQSTSSVRLFASLDGDPSISFPESVLCAMSVKAAVLYTSENIHTCMYVCIANEVRNSTPQLRQR